MSWFREDYESKISVTALSTTKVALIFSLHEQPKFCLREEVTVPHERSLSIGRFLRRIDIDHPYLAPVVHTECTTGKILCFAEAGTGETLHDRINSPTWKGVSQKDILSFFGRLCLATLRLHALDVPHSGIKLENIVFFEDGPALGIIHMETVLKCHGLIPNVSGFRSFLLPRSGSAPPAVDVPEGDAAPDARAVDPHDGGDDLRVGVVCDAAIRRACAEDVWELGRVLYQMLAHTEWAGEMPSDVYLTSGGIPLGEGIGDDLRTILSESLAPDASARGSVASLLSVPSLRAVVEAEYPLLSLELRVLDLLVGCRGDDIDKKASCLLDVSYLLQQDEASVSDLWCAMGGLPVLMAAVREHAPAVSVPAAWALSRLSTGRVSRYIFREGLVSSVVSLLVEGSTTAKKAATGLIAAVAFDGNDSIRMYLRQSGVHLHLQELVSQTDELSAASALLAMCILPFNVDVEEVLVRCCSPDRLVRLLNVTDPVIRYRALRAVANIAYSAPPSSPCRAGMDDLAMANFAHTAVGAREASLRHEAVFSIRLLLDRGGWSEPQHMFAAVQALVQVVHMYPDEIETVSEAVQAVRVAVEYADSRALICAVVLPFLVEFVRRRVVYLRLVKENRIAEDGSAETADDSTSMFSPFTPRGAQLRPTASFASGATVSEDFGAGVVAANSDLDLHHDVQRGEKRPVDPSPLKHIICGVPSVEGAATTSATDLIGSPTVLSHFAIHDSPAKLTFRDPIGPNVSHVFSPSPSSKGTPPGTPLFAGHVSSGAATKTGASASHAGALPQRPTTGSTRAQLADLRSPVSPLATDALRGPLARRTRLAAALRPLRRVLSDSDVARLQEQLKSDATRRLRSQSEFLSHGRVKLDQMNMEKEAHATTTRDRRAFLSHLTSVASPTTACPSSSSATALASSPAHNDVEDAAPSCSDPCEGLPLLSYPKESCPAASASGSTTTYRSRGLNARGVFTVYNDLPVASRELSLGQGVTLDDLNEKQKEKEKEKESTSAASSCTNVTVSITEVESEGPSLSVASNAAGLVKHKHGSPPGSTTGSLEDHRGGHRSEEGSHTPHSRPEPSSGSTSAIVPQHPDALLMALVTAFPVEAHTAAVKKHCVEAVDAIVILANDAKCVGTIINLTTVTVLTQLLALENDSDIKVSATASLCAIAREVLGQEFLVKCNGVPTVLQLLKDRDDDIKTAAATSLVSLAMNKACRGHVLALGGLTCLRSLQEEQEFPSEAVAGAIYCLESLASDGEQPPTLPENAQKPLVETTAVDQVPLLPLVELLKEGDAESRYSAASMLFLMAEKEENHESIVAANAVPALVPCLEDVNRRVRCAATGTLFRLCTSASAAASIATSGGVDALVSLLIDEDITTRSAAVGSIRFLAEIPDLRGRMLHAGVEDLLLRLLEFEDDDVRATAAVAMSLLSQEEEVKNTLAEPGTFEKIIRLLEDGVQSVRAAGCVTLLHTCIGKEGPVSALLRTNAPALLTSLLADPDCTIRTVAVKLVLELVSTTEGAKRVAAEGAVGELLSCLSSAEYEKDDVHPEWRRRGRMGLRHLSGRIKRSVSGGKLFGGRTIASQVQLHSRNTIPSRRRAMKSPRPRSRGPSFSLPHLRSCSHVSAATAREDGASVGGSALPSPRSDLSDADTDAVMPSRALLGLETLRDATQALRVLLPFGVEAVTLAAPMAVRTLERLLRLEDSRGRMEAVKTLGEMGTLDAFKPYFDGNEDLLINMTCRLDDVSAEVRYAASEAVARLALVPSYRRLIGSAGAIDMILDLLEEPALDPKASSSAAIALFRLSLEASNRKQIASGGAARLFLELLVRSEGELRAAVGDALLVFCSDAPNRKLLCDIGIKKFVSLMASEDVELRYLATATVRMLTLEAANTSRILASNGIFTLVELLWDADVRIQKAAVGALRSLAAASSCKKRIVVAGGVVPLVSLIEHDDESIRKESIELLMLLTSVSCCRYALRDLDTVHNLKSLAASDPNPMVRRAARAAHKAVKANAVTKIWVNSHAYHFSTYLLPGVHRRLGLKLRLRKKKDSLWKHGKHAHAGKDNEKPFGICDIGDGSIAGLLHSQGGGGNCRIRSPSTDSDSTDSMSSAKERQPVHKKPSGQKGFGEAACDNADEAADFLSVGAKKTPRRLRVAPIIVNSHPEEAGGRLRRGGSISSLASSGFSFLPSVRSPRSPRISPMV